MTRESLSPSAQEVAEKDNRVRGILSSQGLSALVLTTQANFAWFTCGGDNRVANGTDLGGTSIIITPDAKYVVCDNIEAPRILDEELAGQGFEFVTYNWWESSLADEIAKLAKGPIGADTPIGSARLFGSEIAQLRYSLTGPEVERYRWLGKTSGECIAETGREIRPGITEHEIAASLAGKLTARGVIPNLILIAADERIEKYRHPIPTDRKLDRCAMLVIGSKKWGLVVSVTRIVHFGPIPAELRRKHDAVMTVDAELIAHTRPGASVDYTFRKGMEAYARAGFPDEWKLHHQGGPTGYAGRDYRAKLGVKDIVHLNQAFA
ncbi:MAG: M24 family metallopeptidase, partial [Armatimonadetes bacterium]|nr:M24 family metallopeptidase [Armatimonadota bacterium]